MGQARGLRIDAHRRWQNWPEPFPGQDEFRGRIIHSHAYKHPSNPLPLVDKRALVLGIGALSASACAAPHPTR